MEDADFLLLAEPLARSKASPRARLRAAGYWILVVAAMLVMVLVWVAQISTCGLGLSMSDAHAADDSEGGTFFWFLLSKAVQFALLGWHSMPIALCAVAQVVRRKDDLLRTRLHSTLFWIPLLSFAVAVALWFLV